MERLTGSHAIGEALAAGRRALHRLVVRSGLAPTPGQQALIDAARGRGVPVEEGATSRSSSERPEPLVLEAGALPELGLEGLMEICPKDAWLVALDGVQDPQNLGAIARVADAAGCVGLLLTRRNVPPLSPAVSRASAGAIEHLPVGRVPNLRRALEALGRQGFWSLGADLEEAPLLAETEARIWEGPLVFVFGAEGQGLRAGIRSALDFRVRIPMHGRVGSLNVSSAAAILLYEARRRRDSREAP